MKTVEQLKAEQAQALAKLERESALAAQLPLPPEFVMDHGKRAPWVTYKRTTLREALDVFRAFEVIPVIIARGSSTEVCPKSELSQDSYENIAGYYAAQIDVSQGASRFGPSAELSFYARVADRTIRVKVDFGRDYIGTCNALSAQKDVIRAGKTERSRILEIRWRANELAFAHTDERIHWSNAHDRETCHYTYLVCSETPDADAGSAMAHALSQLTALADAMHEPALGE